MFDIFWKFIFIYFAENKYINFILLNINYNFINFILKK